MLEFLDMAVPRADGEQKVRLLEGVGDVAQSLGLAAKAGESFTLAIGLSPATPADRLRLRRKLATAFLAKGLNARAGEEARTVIADASEPGHGADREEALARGVLASIYRTRPTSQKRCWNVLARCRPLNGSGTMTWRSRYSRSKAPS